MKETMPNDSAFPLFTAPGLLPQPESGLTKREFIATMCLQGILSNSGWYSPETEDLYTQAIDFADHLIKELNK